MSVLIPLHRIASRAIRPRLFSGNQEGVFGGMDLATPRMGDRFAVDIATARLRQDAQTRQLVAALTEATTSDARIALPHLDLKRPSMTGATVVVDGAGQQGSVINLRGAQPQSVIVRGQFLTIVHGGAGFLHMASAQVFVGADGKASLPIWPMLRFVSVDAEPVLLDRPYIQGRLVGFDRGATFIRNRVEPLQFSIEERA